MTTITILMCLMIAFCNPNIDVFEIEADNRISFDDLIPSPTLRVGSDPFGTTNGMIDKIGFYGGELEAIEEMLSIIGESYPEILEDYKPQPYPFTNITK